SRLVERELVDVAASLFDPADHAAEREQAADDGELDESRDPDERQRDPHRGQRRQHARFGEVDLLAHRRRLGLQRAHETYTAATTKVMPNMNMQIAPTISPVRRFLSASRRFMPVEKHSRERAGPYSFASATIAQNSSAR